MSDHQFSYAEGTVAFRYASQWWRSLVGAVEDRWDQAALGEWTVRELVAHTDRAYTTLLDYVGGDVKDPTPLNSAGQYFRTVLTEQTPHVHIAERGRKEAGRVSDWVAETDRLATEVDRFLADTTGEQAMHLFVGEMPLDQYLPTRVTELVIHGTDLAAALGLATDPPVVASRLVVEVLLDLADPGDHGSIVRLLTGRPASLPLTHVLD